MARLAQALKEAPKVRLPPVVVAICRMLLAHVGSLSDQIARLERELRQRARKNETTSRLMTIPRIGVICATAMEALAPPPEGFAKGRYFAAWLGLTRARACRAARCGLALRPRWANEICDVS